MFSKTTLRYLRFWVQFSERALLLSKTTLSNLILWVQLDKGQWKTPVNLQALPKLYTRSYRPLKSQISDFLTVFLKNFLNFLDNHLAIPEILGSILRTGFEKLLCLCDYAQFFFSKRFGPRNFKNYDFVIVFSFKDLDFSRKVLSQI